MCGIAGFLQPQSFSSASGTTILKQMANTIIHRGPDDQGFWLDNEKGIALAHQRLSILDLSPSGNQPMISRSGRYAIVFNGEIYNHLDVRSKLVGLNIDWRGHSDTETLLAAFEHWGIKSTIEKCVGMFAFAVWDKKTNNLILARDRMGEKPIYFGWQGMGNNSCFIFGSELKALKAHPSFSGEVNQEALNYFTTYGYIPAPYSIFTGIKKLEPGHLLTVSASEKEPQITAYWSFEKVALGGNSNPTKLDERSAIDTLESFLMSAVKQQMIADVPVGAFLSGGIDSSTVVSLMQAQSTDPIKTFSIGFNEKHYDEAAAAKEVASFLGTDHTELYVTPQDALDLIPNLPHLYCEPFADSSQIPTLLISSLAKQKVKVSLSGDGGDEIFGGYNRHIFTNKLWSKISRLPSGMRQLLANLIFSAPPQTINRVYERLEFFIPNSLLSKNLGEKMHKVARILPSQNIEELYFGLTSSGFPEDTLDYNLHFKDEISTILSSLPQLSNAEKMMALDSILYLPNDILVKLDRAAMSQSLETRAPFLDHRVVEFAWKIPQSMKIKNNTSKWILRKILHKRIPEKMVNRPKMGFGVPIDGWLRGPLKEWAVDLLDKSRLKNDGFFDADIVQNKWMEHLSGKRNSHHQLWNILMFQAWLDCK